jgi:hypothetical protein
MHTLPLLFLFGRLSQKRLFAPHSTASRKRLKIAGAENINPSYFSWVLRMTLPAPDTVEAILAGRQPQGLTMRTVMDPFPVEWKAQIRSS